MRTSVFTNSPVCLANNTSRVPSFNKNFANFHVNSRMKQRICKLHPRHVLIGMSRILSNFSYYFNTIAQLCLLCSNIPCTLQINYCSRKVQKAHAFDLCIFAGLKIPTPRIDTVHALYHRLNFSNLHHVINPLAAARCFR
jgi:hypothetical protein